MLANLLYLALWVAVRARGTSAASYLFASKPYLWQLLAAEDLFAFLSLHPRLYLLHPNCTEEF